jgi:hypothetical protein
MEKRLQINLWYIAFAVLAILFFQQSLLSSNRPLRVGERRMHYVGGNSG